MKRKGGLGWIPEALTRGARTQEEGFWRDLPLAGLVIYDIGAFHGILTLFFASRAAQVIAYEPNQINHGRLIENIRLNNLTNIQVRQCGVGEQSGSGMLQYSTVMLGAGTLDQSAIAPIAQPVRITTLDEDIAVHSLPAPDLIKIDIEGWELAALQGAAGTLATHRPALFLEMHGGTMREKRSKTAAILAFLRAAGYHDILHVESGEAVTAGNENMAAEGHLYCQYTASRSIHALPTPHPLYRRPNRNHNSQPARAPQCAFAGTHV
jgi:FkbM family methyltransferase